MGRNYRHPHTPDRKALKYPSPAPRSLAQELFHQNSHNHHGSGKPPLTRVESPFDRLSPPTTQTFHTKAGHRPGGPLTLGEGRSKAYTAPTQGDMTGQRLSRDSVPLPDNSSVWASTRGGTLRRSLVTKCNTPCYGLLNFLY
jgi:hypothetical protein